MIEATWQEVSDPPVDRLHEGSAIAWTGRHFVVAGTIERVVPDRSEGIAFWTSEDGLAWTMGDERSAGRVNDFAFDASGPGVAIGFLGPAIAAWSSAGGVVWAKVRDQSAFLPQGSETGLMMHGIARMKTGFLAIGESLPFPGKAVVITSPDGVAWTRMPLDPMFSGVRLDDIAGADGRLVLVGHVRSPFRNLVWTSDDGQTWSQVGDLPGAAPTDNRAGTYQVSAGPAGVLVTLPASEFYALPDRAWWSADGATWAPAAALPEFGLRTNKTNVFATPSGFGAIGWSDSCTSGLWMSSDATSWACVAGGPSAVGRGDWIAAASGDALVTSGDAGTLWAAVLDH